MISYQAIAGMLVLGICAGVLSGMFGIGGGLLIVPALVVVYGFDQKTATGTSLFALLLPVGLLAVIDYYKMDKLSITAGFMIAVGIFFGAYVGARITHGLSDLSMKRVYAGFLVIVAAYYLFSSTEKGRAILRPGSLQKTKN